MKLLVSVSSAEEARAAVEGGADIIDAKDPARGALGPVRPQVFSDIRDVVADGHLVTAALGEAGDELDVEELARDLVRRGAGLVKLGLAGLTDSSSVDTAIRRVVEAGASANESSGVVAVVYADVPRGASVRRDTVVELAARSGARGVLADTADKDGPGLTALWTARDLAAWISDVHAHGMFAAVAGRLSADDLSVVCDAGADIAGVRGAACVGGRLGTVSRERVRALSFRAQRGALSPRKASTLSGR